MKTQTNPQSLACTLLMACGLIVSGCATPIVPKPPRDAASVQSTDFWQPHLLYLLASPHPRLCVEIDAVEGCAPSDAEVARLRDFLAAYCNKPDGIEMHRSDLIPVNAARGMPAGALAGAYLDGPRGTPGRDAPAFMYFLYYDDRLADNPAPAAASTRRRHAERPRVDFLPYPAMAYINVRYGPKRMRDVVQLHEAGHLLGLVARTTGASDHHCLNDSCLMNSEILVHIGRMLIGLDPVKQRQLCESCMGELEENASSAPPNLRFSGAVLVRSEAEYHVLSLPNRAELVVGSLTDEDCREFARASGAKNPLAGDRNERTLVDAIIKEDVLADPAKMYGILGQAVRDPYGYVRMIAMRAGASAGAGRGYFTNAIAFCRAGILSNPHDAWFYNQLAWILATCPDASVRNGAEAVTAATRGCELTGWKDRDLIDTLAAAWAEAGDFDRAVAFQEHALQTREAAGENVRDMQKRLALYKQSRPFRTGPERRP